MPTPKCHICGKRKEGRTSYEHVGGKAMVDCFTCYGCLAKSLKESACAVQLLKDKMEKGDLVND